MDIVASKNTGNDTDGEHLKDLKITTKTSTKVGLKQDSNLGPSTTWTKGVRCTKCVCVFVCWVVVVCFCVLLFVVVFFFGWGAVRANSKYYVIATATLFRWQPEFDQNRNNFPNLI